jgi:hypothetical protein
MMAEGNSAKKVRRVVEWGNDWGLSIARQLQEAGHSMAQARLDSGKFDATDGYIDVDVPINVKIRYRIAADLKVLAPDAGTAQCSCVFHLDSHGGSVCICTGPGAGELSCDCAGPVVV